MPDPAAAALVTQIAAMEVASERAAVRPIRDPRIGDESVISALTDMLSAYSFGLQRTHK
jgi:hypothetical protein